MLFLLYLSSVFACSLFFPLLSEYIIREYVFHYFKYDYGTDIYTFLLGPMNYYESESRRRIVDGLDNFALSRSIFLDVCMYV